MLGANATVQNLHALPLFREASPRLRRCCEWNVHIDPRKFPNPLIAGIPDGEHSNIRINANSVSQCPFSSTHFGA